MQCLTASVEGTVWFPSEPVTIDWVHCVCCWGNSVAAGPVLKSCRYYECNVCNMKASGHICLHTYYRV